MPEVKKVKYVAGQPLEDEERRKKFGKYHYLAMKPGDWIFADTFQLIALILDHLDRRISKIEQKLGLPVEEFKIPEEYVEVREIYEGPPAEEVKQRVEEIHEVADKICAKLESKVGPSIANKVANAIKEVAEGLAEDPEEAEDLNIRRVIDELFDEESAYFEEFRDSVVDIIWETLRETLNELKKEEKEGKQNDRAHG
ncbi:MAG: hypothetical protein ACTSXX_02080 [Candidatus Baldrarchaeia archaeon]